MKKLITMLVIAAILQFSGSILLAQQSTFERNILLEEQNGGSPVTDLLYANDLLFAYSSNKLLVYNSTGDQLLQTVKLTNLGKFAPRFYQTSVGIPDANFMAYNSLNNLLYVVRADLKVEAFQVGNNSIVSMGVVIETPSTNTGMKSLHGYSLLRYDETNNRLFWVIEGKSVADNGIGHFHVRSTYFGIYKSDLSGQSFSLLHSEFHLHNDDSPTSTNYLTSIYDVEFIPTNNHFYLARKRSIDVFKINENPIPPQLVVEEVTKIVVPEGKIGKLLKVPEINKMIAFPYRLPFLVTSSWEPDSSTFETQFYVIDIANPASAVGEITAPDRRILDAVYLPSTQDLILCRNPLNDPANQNVEEQDIAIYHWNGSTFSHTPSTDLLSTNGFPDYEVPNTPLRMLRVNDNNILISKKHEITQLVYNPLSSSYSYNQKRAGINNYFFTAVKGSSNTFIMSMINNGIVKLLPTTYNFSDFIKTSSPIFHITHNVYNSRLFFYNELICYNGGVYMYNLEDETIVNLNDINKEGEKITNPVGDIVYCPATNHILISENAPVTEIDGIKYYDGTTGKYIGKITTINGYCKDMFVSPSGYLYVAASMHQANSSKPRIHIYDIDNNYQLVNNQLVDIPIPNTYFKYYNADFCYNYTNGFTYATFKPIMRQINSPYTAAAGSSEILTDAGPDADINGILLKLSNNIVDSDNTLKFPGKILFRSSPEASQQNTNGYLFIQGEDLIIFNCDNGDKITLAQNFTDITYSENNDKLYGITLFNSSTTGTGTRLYEVSSTGISTLLKEFSNGSSASCIFNPFDNFIYLYNWTDSEMLGDMPTKVIMVDPVDANNPLDIELGNNETKFNCYGQELVQKTQTPYINPYNSTMYFPNGAHGSFSLVNFEATDELILDASSVDGNNWISIPRHEGNGTYNAYDPFSTSSVFSNGNFENNYTSLDLDYNLVNSTGEFPVYAQYNITTPFDWDYISDMSNSFSYRGYKLTLTPTSVNENTITMHGNVEYPNTKMELFKRKENWVGYFLFEEQDIFDAIADIEDQIYMLKHEDFVCIRQEPIEGGGVPQEPLYPWVCNVVKHNIKYGDMVVIKPFMNIESFRWNYSGNPPLTGIDEQPEQFTYAETSDYSPIIIELDSTENPVEIGAMVNDSCIGACTVSPEDSVVVLRAYLGTLPGENIVFEEYFDTKSTNKVRRNNYFVFNSQNGKHENRSLKTGENKEAYYVSFKNKGESGNSPDDHDIIVYPNPAKTKLNITYKLERSSDISIELFDGIGRKISEILNTSQPGGSYSINWNIQSNNGSELIVGLYILKIRINNKVISNKLVIN